jgi:peroxiredoxin
MTLKGIELQSKIDSLNEDLDNNAPKELLNGLALEIIKVSQSQVTRRAKQRGEQAPLFTLPNAVNKKVSLQEYLEKGLVVLVWYRGGWCPYCNTMLHELQLYLPQINAAGANLLAISPDSPDSSLSNSEKHDLAFEVLSDHNNEVAHNYNIAYSTGETTQGFIKSVNGEVQTELPLAAVYIIDQTGLIRYAFLDADFRRRAEPYDIVTTLQNIAKIG